MTDKYQVLQILYEIVKDDSQPLQYHCSTREIILRLRSEWQQEYLEELKRENLLEIKKSNTAVVVLITEKGLEKAKRVFAMRDNGL